jgi:hypothetical protein
LTRRADRFWAFRKTCRVLKTSRNGTLTREPVPRLVAWLSTTRTRPVLLPSPRTRCRQLLTHPPRPPPFFRQFFLAGLLTGRCRLGLSPRLYNRSPSLRRFCLRNRLYRPRWRRASRGQVARKAQLLRKFLLLDSGAGLFRNLVGDRGLWLRCFGNGFRMAFLCQRTRWRARSGGPASHPLWFVYETPDGAQHMGNRDVHAPFPENLRDPMDAEAATMRFQDLFFVLPQGVDLRLLPVTAALGSARDLKKILGSGFEMIRISQCELERVFRVYDQERTNWRSN